MVSNEIESSFQALADSTNDEVDVVLGALLIAAIHDQEVDMHSEMSHLDALAAGARSWVVGTTNPLSALNALSEYLFDEVGFRGNTEEYYDPMNSLLHKVLDRRVGIPITLSLVYIEVGRRLGVPLLGIGMPGHFLVRHRDVEDLFVDTFNGGFLLSVEECLDRLRFSQGDVVELGPDDLLPVTNREFIARILRNLKGIYWNRDQFRLTLKMVDWLTRLLPGSIHEIRDRGLVNLRLGNYNEALGDLERYLGETPSGPDVESVKHLIRRTRLAFFGERTVS